jgi:hypothetical protein
MNGEIEAFTTKTIRQIQNGRTLKKDRSTRRTNWRGARVGGTKTLKLLHF